MSTRSITTVRSKWIEDDFETLATIYRHWDGYLRGHGVWLCEFLNKVTITNGRVDEVDYVNGPGELAGLLITRLYQDGHRPNLVPQGTTMGQEYLYQISVTHNYNGGDITLQVFSGPMTAFGAGGEDCNKLLFTGTIAEYGEFLAKEAKDE